MLIASHQGANGPSWTSSGRPVGKGEGDSEAIVDNAARLFRDDGPCLGFDGTGACPDRTAWMSSTPTAEHQSRPTRPARAGQLRQRRRDAPTSTGTRTTRAALGPISSSTPAETIYVAR
jgi:hypothetical protein